MNTTCALIAKCRLNRLMNVNDVTSWEIVVKACA